MYEVLETSKSHKSKIEKVVRISEVQKSWQAWERMVSILRAYTRPKNGIEPGV